MVISYLWLIIYLSLGVLMGSIGICCTAFAGNTRNFTNQRNRICIINQEMLEITPAAWIYHIRLKDRSIRIQCRTHSMISSREVWDQHNYSSCLLQSIRIKASHPHQLEEQMCPWVNNMPFSRKKLIKKLLSSIRNKNSKYNNSSNNITLCKSNSSNKLEICHNYCNNNNNNSIKTAMNKQ